jgi:hypothetical protein
MTYCETKSRTLEMHSMRLLSHGNEFIEVTADINHLNDRGTTSMMAVLYRRLRMTKVLQSNPSYSNPYP